MSESKRNSKDTGGSGDTNSTDSIDKSGIGSGSGTGGSADTGKQVKTDVKKNLVEQNKPKEVVIELETENKEDKKTTPKPKKPRKKTPTKKAKVKQEQEQIKDIQNLLEGIFMVVSLKGGEHWTLQSDESIQIADPLSKILDRYDLLGKASEVSDPVALIIATLTIILPRVMINKMSVAEKKTKTLQNNGVMNNDKKRDPVRNGGTDDNTIKKSNQSNDGEFIKSLSTEIQTGF